MNSKKFKFFSSLLFLLIWILLVIFFLSPWYEEKFKYEEYDFKLYKFNNFLINNKKVEYNKIDYIDGDASYFEDAFGFSTPTLSRVIKATKALSSLAFINTSMLIIFTIIFIIHTRFLVDGHHGNYAKEKRIWKICLGILPSFTFILLLLSVILIVSFPTAVRQDCLNQFDYENCESQSRFHRSFFGGNSTWTWGPSKGWIILLIDCLLSFIAMVYCAISVFIIKDKNTTSK